MGSLPLWCVCGGGGRVHAFEPWHNTYHCLVGAYFLIFFPHRVSPGTASCSIASSAGSTHLAQGRGSLQITDEEIPEGKGRNDQILLEQCLAQNHTPLNTF